MVNSSPPLTHSRVRSARFERSVRPLPSDLTASTTRLGPGPIVDHRATRSSPLVRMSITQPPTSRRAVDADHGGSHPNWLMNQPQKRCLSLATLLAIALPLAFGARSATAAPAPTLARPGTEAASAQAFLGRWDLTIREQG